MTNETPTEVEAQPFPEVPSDIRAERAGSNLGSAITPYTDVKALIADGVVDAEEITDAPPHLEKEHLVGQPFILRDVRVLTDAATVDDEGEMHDLVIFAGQAVEIGRDGQISKLGFLFTCTAGAEVSVAGQQIMEDSMSARRTGRAILYRQGFRKQAARLGDYYTLRERASKDVKVNLFDR